MNERPDYLKILDAAKATGLSAYFIRNGCRDGSIPCIRCGTVFFVNMPAFRAQLDEQCRH